MKKVLVLLLAAMSAGVGCGPSSKALESGDAVAEVDGRKIGLDEIDAAIEPELARIKSEQYAARKAKLEEMIDDALLAHRAKELDVPTAELVKREITAKTKLPSDEDVKATFEKVKDRTTASFDAVAPQIREMLARKATTERRNEVLAALRKEAHVVVRLAPPRFAIDIAGGHSNGAKNAPITFVEFSDYQCPFCGRSQATVAEVLEKYGGRIHHVFMDFPIASIHPFAKPAAVASRCAEEQGKYDEYHRLLFDRQRELSTDNFKRWAADLKMDAAKFDACLESGKFDSLIEESIRVGERVGVSGTPGFFVNGIPIHGAQPFTVFEKTIDEELTRAG
jgi:predicted DsbA family dithiol-disulfide isomerase